MKKKLLRIQNQKFLKKRKDIKKKKSNNKGNEYWKEIKGKYSEPGKHDAPKKKKSYNFLN